MEHRLRCSRLETHGSGAAYPADPAVGSIHGKGHREGNPDFGYRNQPVERWKSHPACVSRADRERRKDLVKEVKKKGEAGKVALRNIRRDANDYLKKLGKTEVSEDEIKDLEDAVQKLTDKYIKEVDKAIEEKSKEILTV